MTQTSEVIREQILACLRQSARPLTTATIAARALPPRRTIKRGKYILEEDAAAEDALPHLEALKAEGKVDWVNENLWTASRPVTRSS
ncbi:hypothetical protein [Mycobacteroides abscessus]|uniref:hypothetical protein n=1 Tax=Mycobacteroides abscessus TaxID=36809 RepID=UPI001041E157|nr:hypothetical protein [Mycobacteroides abscessus]